MCSVLPILSDSSLFVGVTLVRLIIGPSLFSCRILPKSDFLENKK
jgi:hypothetical protein